MRRSLAIDAECFAPEEFDRIKLASQSALRREWAVEAADEPSAATILPGPGRPGTARTMVAMSGRGKFGRYLKRATTFPDYLHALTSADAQAVIEDLLRVLAGDGAGLLSRTHEPHRGLGL